MAVLPFLITIAIAYQQAIGAPSHRVLHYYQSLTTESKKQQRS
jgi:hypothetical protein